MWYIHYQEHVVCYSYVKSNSKRGTYIKGLFWPPLEPKTENCFLPISFDWFIRRMTEV